MRDKMFPWLYYRDEIMDQEPPFRDGRNLLNVKQEEGYERVKSSCEFYSRALAANLKCLRFEF